MMIDITPISGCMLGFEIVSKSEIGEESGFFIVVDLFIARLLITF